MRPSLSGRESVAQYRGGGTLESTDPGDIVYLDGDNLPSILDTGGGTLESIHPGDIVYLDGGHLPRILDTGGGTLQSTDPGDIVYLDEGQLPSSLDTGGGTLESIHPGDIVYLDGGHLPSSLNTGGGTLESTHSCDLLYLDGNVGRRVDEVVERRTLFPAGGAAEDVLVVQRVEAAVVTSALHVGRVALGAVVCGRHTSPSGEWLILQHTRSNTQTTYSGKGSSREENVTD